ncbi:hypothetical protein [Epilithonimonas mollis]|uniref:PBCV-specific basic adaptor domain-containing protein n=1 Tax=Epilithonimonas mollis TaxID=216903 RepID=A0A1M6R600_9FLAO|nr:hypothetical protein [Epilithonimonas mollis]SHK27873.1 hypothetical protein SAMN05444371_1702 [Epilithonimonas mollis]
MKNLLTALLLTLGVGVATAQTTAPAATKKQTQKTEKKATKSIEAQAAKVANTPDVKMKKDGTPDKRYKANKMLKKDGTPDKRYKANK